VSRLSDAEVRKAAVTELLVDVLDTVIEMAGDLHGKYEHFEELLEDVAGRLGTTWDDVWLMHRQREIEEGRG
jgi:fructose-1,6-bisphosphatase